MELPVPMKHSRVGHNTASTTATWTNLVVVSKAFQVLSDANMRASFDANPSYDPTQRNPGMSSSGMRSHAGRGGGGGMYADELNPEDLFNMFFGGGGRGGQFGGGQFGNANGVSHCQSGYVP